MKEAEAQFYFVETLSAIAHLHKKGTIFLIKESSTEISNLRI